MKYLKKFENHQAYTAAESGLILPNVSLCVQENEVHYKPIPDPYAGHEYVDLGLPSGTKWATMNVGATSPTECGNYYMYGMGAAQYASTSGQSAYSGLEDPLAASADTATQVWGGSWHMPTSAQCQELSANTTYQWVTNYQGSGIDGATFSANGQILFIPAAGAYNAGAKRNDVNGVWTSTPYNKNNSYRFGFLDNLLQITTYFGSLTVGMPIRPVVG